MDVRAFDFDLPPELIAQEPAADRGAARLLCLDRATGATSHATVASLPDRLTPGDLVVVNDTRVFPARLLGRRVPSGGAVECLLIARIEGDTLGSADAPGPEAAGPALSSKAGARTADSWRSARAAVLWPARRSLWTDDGSPVDAAVDAIGHVPLPPYIKRDDRVDDRERYQTVFARARGSVAAPTAGLHFSPALVDALGDRGVEIARITLHVGYGTFQPVRADRVEDHRLEPERYEIGEAAAAAINGALDAGRRVIAVGTTTTRTLEAVAGAHGGRIVAGGGATDLFIHPGFDFRVIGGLLTNFHLPQSSLLMLVSAFAGRERVLAAYREAVARGYRFYSYGDAMLIT